MHQSSRFPAARDKGLRFRALPTVVLLAGITACSFETIDNGFVGSKYDQPDYEFPSACTLLPKSTADDILQRGLGATQLRDFDRHTFCLYETAYDISEDDGDDESGDESDGGDGDGDGDDGDTTGDGPNTTDSILDGLVVGGLNVFLYPQLSADYGDIDAVVRELGLDGGSEFDDLADGAMSFEPSEDIAIAVVTFESESVAAKIMASAPKEELPIEMVQSAAAAIARNMNAARARKRGPQ